MDQFKLISIEDKDILKKYLVMSKHIACDYSLANLILWADVYQTHYAVEQDMLFIKFGCNPQCFFAYPMGNGDMRTALEWLKGYCKEQNQEFRLNPIEKEMFEEIESLYPGMYDIAYARDNADYIYNMEDLRDLTGKKYHGKKNHVNKFLKTNEEWTYERITDENTKDCEDMVRLWCVVNGCCDDKSKADEICVLLNGLKHREALNLIGGIIRIEERIVALTMGERISSETFVIHFEKAFADVDGAYTMINQQFIINELTEYKYINREEDMGKEGLRRAKESYQPAFLAEKGIVTAK